MILKIDNQINKIDLHPLRRYTSWCGDFSKYFPMEPGVNHHCLLAYLSSQLPDDSLVGDLGTLYGQSAVALSFNQKVKVVTIDIALTVGSDKLDTFLKVPNIRFIKGDCINYLEALLNASIILLDIAPHDGIQEERVYQKLRLLGYRGLLICDDIHAFAEMKPFWEHIKLKKLDVTKYGHHSGTGIVVFDPSFIDVEVE